MTISSLRIDCSKLNETYSVQTKSKNPLKQGDRTIEVSLNFVSNKDYWKREAERYSTRDLSFAYRLTHPSVVRTKKASEANALSHIEEWTELVLEGDSHTKYRIRLDLEQGEYSAGFFGSKRLLLRFFDLISKGPIDEPVRKVTSLRKWETVVSGDNFRIYLKHISTTSSSRRCIANCKKREEEWGSFGKEVQKSSGIHSKVERAVTLALSDIANLKIKEVAALRQQVSANPKELLQMEVKKVRIVSSSVGGGAVIGGLLGMFGGPFGAIAGALIGGLFGAAGGTVVHEDLEETVILPSKGLHQSRLVEEKTIPYLGKRGEDWNLKEVSPIKPALALKLGMQGERRLYNIIGSRDYVWINKGEQESRWDRAHLDSLRTIQTLENEITAVRENPIHEEQNVDFLKRWVYGELHIVISKVTKKVNPEREIAIYDKLAKEWASQGVVPSKKVKEVQEKKSALLKHPKTVDFARFTILDKTGQSIGSNDLEPDVSFEEFLSRIPFIDAAGELDFLDVEAIDEFERVVSINGSKTRIRLAKITQQNKYVWVLTEKASFTNTWIYVDPCTEKKVRGLETVQKEEKTLYCSRMKVDFAKKNELIFPAGIRYPSKWDSKELLDDDRASLTILSVGGCTPYGLYRGIAGHAMLCYEGVQDGLPFIRYAHLTEKNNVEIKENKDGKPLWVWEAKNPKAGFSIRIRSKAYYVDSQLVYQMDRRIRAHARGAWVSFSMTAPWQNYYQGDHEAKKARLQGKSTESCITYAAWVARDVIPGLPEPYQLNPDEYIKELNGAVTFR